ncbi:MAG: ATP synthase F0 subunit B [Proteobacteria bacterium]|nr:ATP synthase F0 subunit B [Pseudomonadota bacterium]
MVEFIETKALITINATVIAQMVSFLIFLFLINRLMFKPLRGVMREREERVEAAGAEIRQTREKMEGLQAELAVFEAAARKEALEVKERLDAEGGKEADGILAEARKKVEHTRQETVQKVEAQIAEARKSLETEARDLGMAVMEKILGRSLG